MTTAASIDKLELHAPNGSFSVRDMRSGLWHRHHVVEGLTADAKEPRPWAVDGKGSPIYGQLQVQIPIGSTVLHVSANTHGVRATVNPNKVVHPFLPIQEPDQLAEVVTEVERRILELVATDVHGMVTQRIDLCRQATTTEPVWKYTEAMRMCKPPRKEAFLEPGGIRYGTARQRVQTAFYDLGRRAAEVDGIDGLPDNIARLEPRFNGVEAVSKNLGIGNVRQLLELGTADLTNAYIRSVNTEVFRLMPETAGTVGQFIIPFAQVAQEIEVYYAAYGRRGRAAVRRWRAALGADAVLRRIGSWPQYERLLVEQLGMDRSTAWRERTDAEQDWKLMPIAKGRPTPASYLRELQDRFTAAA